MCVCVPVLVCMLTFAVIWKTDLRADGSVAVSLLYFFSGPVSLTILLTNSA